MPPYDIQWTPAAVRQFRKLERNFQLRIAKAVDKLVNNPFPSGVKKLLGENSLYRIRVGDYRIIYQFNSGKLVILIVRLGHRKEISDILTPRKMK